MAGKEKTSSRVGTLASKVLQDSGASKVAKQLAGSALAQTGTGKQSSATVASAAGRALADDRSSRSTRTLAGSVETQRPGKKSR
jgi:hypothetical protein